MFSQEGFKIKAVVIRALWFDAWCVFLNILHKNICISQDYNTAFLRIDIPCTQFGSFIFQKKLKFPESNLFPSSFQFSRY